MSAAWPLVALGEVLELKVDAVPVDSSAMYQIAGVYSFGKGLLTRGPLSGAETTYKVFHRLHKDDFVLSQLKAWEGALARITASYDGWFLSPQFPTFRAKPDHLDIAYLDWFCKQSEFWDQLRSSARGMGDRRDSVSPAKFLSATIPLPPLAEQRRIVARIEVLSAKIAEARGLRRQAVEEAEALITSEELKLWPASCLNGGASLQDVTSYLARGRQSEQGISQHYLVKSQHVQMGRYVRSNLTLASHVASKVAPDAAVRDRDILIACSAAGCLGRVAYYVGEPGRMLSTDTHVAIARANPEKILPEYLYAYLRGAQGQIQLRSREKGDWTREKISFRLTELNVADMRKVPIPLPSLPEQRRIVAYLDNFQAKIAALKRHQTDTAAELDAMIPSILDKAFKGKLFN